jgi:hypothetical protein
MDIIKIHPFDLGAMLQAATEEEPTITIVKIEDKEYVDYKGQRYEQTVDVPVTSDWGKQVLEDAKHVDLRES